MDISTVAITGYYGSGSSAVIDLLKEYDGVNITPFDGYEHIVFYSPNGLFDLGSIIRYSNTPYNSDGAIGRFKKEMDKLNNNNFGGFGSYKFLTGEKFNNNVTKFIGKISKSKSFKGSCHVESVKFSFLKAILQIAAKLVFGRKILKLGRKYVYDKMEAFIGLPTNEEFRDASREFVSNYFSLFNKPKYLNVYDHLIWPQNFKDLNFYFNNSLKMIVVNRDPRDVFLLNKYFWHNPPRILTKPYFPTNVEEFCEEWKRTIVRDFDNQNILSINFEDLIYKPNDTCEIIEKFLGLKSSVHINKTNCFDPNKSIENTQIFTLPDVQKRKEAAYIEKNLSEYLYNFPYERNCDKSKWFDNPNVDLKRNKK